MRSLHRAILIGVLAGVAFVAVLWFAGVRVSPSPEPVKVVVGESHRPQSSPSEVLPSDVFDDDIVSPPPVVTDDDDRDDDDEGDDDDD